jgi:hypothetical protein
MRSRWFRAIGHTLRAHEALGRPDALPGFLEVVHRLYENGLFAGHHRSIRTVSSDHSIVSPFPASMPTGRSFYNSANNLSPPYLHQAAYLLALPRNGDFCLQAPRRRLDRVTIRGRAFKISARSKNEVDAPTATVRRTRLGA